MHCWKSINLNKQYGVNRILLLSILTMLLAFITLFTFLSLTFSVHTYRDDYAFFFLMALIFLYPTHKFLHFIPLIFMCKKVTFEFKSYNFIHDFPLKMKDPVSKKYFLFTLLTPFSFITILLFVCTISYPAYAHYFTILLSVHFGICVSDFITLWNLLKSPQKCLVEKSEDGFEILIPKCWHVFNVCK